MKIKKIVALLLTLALLAAGLAALGGCQSDSLPERSEPTSSNDSSSAVQSQEPVASKTESSKPSSKNTLRICVDGWLEPDCEQFRALLEEMGGPTDVEFIILTGGYEGAEIDEAQRKAMITGLRTEIMAGKGPDVYIVSTTFADSLFRFPVKNLELGMFLDLEPYIENAQFMEWDEMIPEIMAVGHSERWGQGIMPMTYTFPVSVYLEEDLDFDSTAYHTWQDMLEDETGVLQTAAGVHGMPANLFFLDGHLAETLGQLADYTEKKLMFTEEELTQRMYEIFEMEEKRRNGDIPEVPEHYDWSPAGGNFYGSNISMKRDNISKYADVYPWDDNSFSFVPVYSDDGGITATVKTFCAVDASTKHVDDALFVIDVLMSKQNLTKQESIFTKGLPVYKEAGSRALKCKAGNRGTTDLYPSSFERFTAIRDQITAVNLYSVADYQLYYLMYRAYNIYFGYEEGTEEDIAKMTTEVYRMLRQSMSE